MTYIIIYIRTVLHAISVIACVSTYVQTYISIVSIAHEIKINYVATYLDIAVQELSVT